MGTIMGHLLIIFVIIGVMALTTAKWTAVGGENQLANDNSIEKNEPL